MANFTPAVEEKFAVPTRKQWSEFQQAVWEYREKHGSSAPNWADTVSYPDYLKSLACDFERQTKYLGGIFYDKESAERFITVLRRLADRDKKSMTAWAEEEKAVEQAREAEAAAKGTARLKEFISDVEAVIALWNNPEILKSIVSREQVDGLIPEQTKQRLNAMSSERFKQIFDVAIPKPEESELTDGRRSGRSCELHLVPNCSHCFPAEGAAELQ